VAKGSEARGAACREIEVERRTGRGGLILGKADPRGAAQGKDERSGEQRSDDSAAARACKRAAQVVTPIVLAAAGLGSGRVFCARDVTGAGESRPRGSGEEALQNERANEDEPKGSSRHRSWNVAAHRASLAIGPGT